MLLLIVLIVYDSAIGTNTDPQVGVPVDSANSAIELSVLYLGEINEGFITDYMSENVSAAPVTVTDTLLLRNDSAKSAWLVKYENILLDWRKDYSVSDTMLSKYVDINVLLDSLSGALLKIEILDRKYPDYEYTRLDSTIMYETGRAKYVAIFDSIPNIRFAAFLKKRRYYEPRISKRIIAILPLVEFQSETFPAWVITLLGKPPYESGMGAIYTNSKGVFDASTGKVVDGGSYGQMPDDYYVLPHKKWPVMINRDGSIPKSNK